MKNKEQQAFTDVYARALGITREQYEQAQTRANKRDKWLFRLFCAAPFIVIILGTIIAMIFTNDYTESEEYGTLVAGMAMAALIGGYYALNYVPDTPYEQAMKILRRKNHNKKPIE